jgi:hypothetical protein
MATTPGVAIDASGQAGIRDTSENQSSHSGLHISLKYTVGLSILEKYTCMRIFWFKLVWEKNPSELRSNHLKVHRMFSVFSDCELFNSAHPAMAPKNLIIRQEFMSLLEVKETPF